MCPPSASCMWVLKAVNLEGQEPGWVRETRPLLVSAKSLSSFPDLNSWCLRIPRGPEDGSQTEFSTRSLGFQRGGTARRRTEECFEVLAEGQFKKKKSEIWFLKKIGQRGAGKTDLESVNHEICPLLPTWLSAVNRFSEAL